jgi:hypothetical protein
MKRWWIAVLVPAAIIAGVATWFFRPPREVSNGELLTYLPPTAEIAVLQRGLEESWLNVRKSLWFKKLIERPEFRKFAKKNRLDRAELSDTEQWILDVFGERALVGYVPDGQLPGRYSIFAFAPIGNRAKRLELWADIIQRGEKSEFKMVSSLHKGQEIVRLSVEGWPPNLIVKYAKIRGVVALVFSESEDALERYLDARGPTSGSSPVASAIVVELGRLGWLQAGACNGRGGLLRWALESAEPGKLRLTAVAPLCSTPSAPAGAAATMPLVSYLPEDSLLKMSGRLSEWSAVVESFIAYFRPDVGGDIRQRLEQMRARAPWLGDHFAAGVPSWQPVSERIPVPAPQVSLAAECLDEKQAQVAINALILDINRRGRVEIAVMPITVKGRKAQQVVAQSEKLAEQITRWPVLSFSEGALLAATGADLMDRMLADKAPAASRSQGNSLFWQVALTRQAARSALSAYTVFLLFTGNQPPPVVAPWLPRIEFALEALAAVRTVIAAGRIDGSDARVVLDAVHEDLPAAKAGGANK